LSATRIKKGRFFFLFPLIALDDRAARRTPYAPAADRPSLTSHIQKNRRAPGARSSDLHPAALGSPLPFFFGTNRHHICCLLSKLFDVLRPQNARSFRRAPEAAVVFISLFCFCTHMQHEKKHRQMLVVGFASKFEDLRRLP
jgi:hypothetical protein